jgi:hypothetical protein
MLTNSRRIYVLAAVIAACSNTSTKSEHKDKTASLALMVEPWGGHFDGIRLSFFEAGLTPQRLHAALAHEAAIDLRQLDISRTGIGDKGLAVIASSPHLKTLESLWASEIGAGDEGARVLANSATLRLHGFLDLQGNQIGPDGVAALASSDVVRDVLYLRLYYNPIGNAGARAIAKGSFPALIDLSLSGIGMGGEGIAAILSPGVLSDLIRLSIGEPYAVPTDGFLAGLAALADPSVLPKLETLYVTNELPKEVRWELARTRPSLKIQSY